MEIIARGQITIWNYKDGDDAYSVILNHDTHAVACDPSGNALGGELGPSGKAVFALSAYRGATKLTMRYSSAASRPVYVPGSSARYPGVPPPRCQEAMRSSISIP